MPKHATPRTLEDFLADLERRDTTVADWAREHGFSLNSVYAITRGRLSGTRGESREIVKRMGLKPPSMFRQRAVA